MAGFEHLLVSGQNQAGVFDFEQAAGFGFEIIEVLQQQIHVGIFEIISGLLHFVLMVNIAVGHGLAVGRVRPHEVIHVFHALQIHGQALDAVGDFTEHGRAIDAAHLLEIGKLGHFHAIEPHFPAQTPSAEGGIFPIVFHKADVVLQRRNTQFFERIEIQLLDILRRGLERHLKLVIVLQAVGIVAVAAVFGAAAGLHIGGKPRLGAERAQAGGGVAGAGAHFHIERLQHHAALRGPEIL